MPRRPPRSVVAGARPRERSARPRRRAPQARRRPRPSAAPRRLEVRPAWTACHQGCVAMASRRLPTCLTSCALLDCLEHRPVTIVPGSAARDGHEPDLAQHTASSASLPERPFWNAQIVIAAGSALRLPAAARALGERAAPAPRFAVRAFGTP
jgi:hypothetical protein